MAKQRMKDDNQPNESLLYDLGIGYPKPEGYNNWTIMAAKGEEIAEAKDWLKANGYKLAKMLI